jgi:SAM-dependent methyltransferase
MLKCAPMQPTLSNTRNARELVDLNRRFYDSLWSDARLVDPQRFNTWPLVESLLAKAPQRLEIAPGLRPRLPIEGTQFVDISGPALAKLQARGAKTVQGEVTALPFADATFDLVCALDIIEHVDDQSAALAEISRVAKSNAIVLVSTPLYAARWTVFDDLVGHKRRYEPTELLDELAQHHLSIERSAAFGMQPKSSRLVDFGMWWLENHREVAMRWYNRAFLPLGLHFQKKLQVADGMIDTDKVDEIFLVCRRHARPE